jgi:hypothetical protein
MILAQSNGSTSLVDKSHGTYLLQVFCQIALALFQSLSDNKKEFHCSLELRRSKVLYHNVPNNVNALHSALLKVPSQFFNPISLSCQSCESIHIRNRQDSTSI